MSAYFTAKAWVAAGNSALSTNVDESAMGTDDLLGSIDEFAQRLGDGLGQLRFLLQDVPSAGHCHLLRDRKYPPQIVVLVHSHLTAEQQQRHHVHDSTVVAGRPCRQRLIPHRGDEFGSLVDAGDGRERAIRGDMRALVA